VWLTILAFGSYHLEYLLSFMFVKLVQPITYGTLDAVRRLGIILAGRAMFGGAPLTWLNRSGIALALLGALGYSLATSG
jgi:multidrug transporter EmrE-like cation transporter